MGETARKGKFSIIESLSCKHCEIRLRSLSATQWKSHIDFR